MDTTTAVLKNMCHIAHRMIDEGVTEIDQIIDEMNTWAWIATPTQDVIYAVRNADESAINRAIITYIDTHPFIPCSDFSHEHKRIMFQAVSRKCTEIREG